MNTKMDNNNLPHTANPLLNSIIAALLLSSAFIDLVLHLPYAGVVALIASIIGGYNYIVQIKNGKSQLKISEAKQKLIELQREHEQLENQKLRLQIKELENKK